MNTASLRVLLCFLLVATSTAVGEKQDSQSRKQEKGGGWTAWKAVTVGGLSIAGAVALPVAVPAVVGAMGFGTAGIVAGSTAAKMMAAYGGTVYAGSLCATLQSVGAAGLTGAMAAASAAVGAAVGAATGFVVPEPKGAKDAQ